MKEPLTTEKVNDASLTKSLISSVIVIVLCMICLLGTTWAWYTSSVESGKNTIVCAYVDVEVSIDNDPGTALDGWYTFTGTEHTVTLTKTGTATYGFCKVIAKMSGDNSEVSYYINLFGENNFQFKVTGSGSLKFIPMLGTPTSATGIPNGGIELTIPSANNIAKSVLEEEVKEEEPVKEGAPKEEEAEQPAETEEPEEEEPVEEAPVEEDTPEEEETEQPAETEEPEEEVTVEEDTTKEGAPEEEETEQPAETEEPEEEVTVEEDTTKEGAPKEEETGQPAEAEDPEEEETVEEAPVEEDTPEEEETEQPNEPTGTESSGTPSDVETLPTETSVNTELSENEPETEPMVPEETTPEAQE